MEGQEKTVKNYIFVLENSSTEDLHKIQILNGNNEV